MTATAVASHRQQVKHFPAVRSGEVFLNQRLKHSAGQHTIHTRDDDKVSNCKTQVTTAEQQAATALNLYSYIIIIIIIIENVWISVMLLQIQCKGTLHSKSGNTLDA